jgi:hypothetical protein
MPLDFFSVKFVQCDPDTLAMCFADTYIAPDKRRQGDRVWGGKCGVPSSPVFGGRAGPAIGFFEGVGAAMSDKLFLGEGVLHLA